MKFENALLIFIAIYIIIDSILSVLDSNKINNLQTQIDELKIIVDQKFLSSMVLDTYNLMPR